MSKKKVKPKWDSGDIKTYGGIMQQMQDANTVSYNSSVTSDNIMAIMLSMYNNMPSSYKHSNSWIYNDVYLEEVEKVEEVIETGVISNLLFGEEGYEIIDGKITRILSIDEINKLKNGTKR